MNGQPTVAATQGPASATPIPGGLKPSVPSLSANGTRFSDRVYTGILLLASLSIFVLILMLAIDLTVASHQSMQRFGWHFVTGSVWNEVTNQFSVMPFIFGTLYSSLIALVIAVPVSIGAAVFLSELAPRWMRTPVAFVIELLAAVPSVVYGLWGIFLLEPWLRDHFMTPIANSPLPKVPVIGSLFQGVPIGSCMLTAGVILAIMVTPFITAVTRDLLRAIPKAQREGSLALGATQWESISKVVLPYARGGIIGAIMLGLGRALGETMAVTMVIGNQSAPTPSGISPSLFAPGYTMASALANKFNEASLGLNTSALIEIGLVLFVVTIVVNIIARLLVFSMAKDMQGGR